MSTSAFAKIHEFETTHLKSKAGTGAAGILMEESAFLNPAGLSFFNQASIFYQQNNMQIKNEAGEIVQKPKSQGFVMADGNDSLSGSLSYTLQEEGQYRRKRWGFSTSAKISETTSFGTSIRKSKDDDLTAQTTKDYYQTVFGVIHAISDKTSLGIISYDAFNSKGNETKAIIGMQQLIADYITLSFDFGGNYNADEISDSLLYRGAVQVRVLNDFYARFGAFNDKEREEKGNGYGLSWVQPKLAFEFAMKNTTQKESQKLSRQETKIRDIAFSASYRF